MREIFDCGVLMVPVHKRWMNEWMARYGPSMSRIRLHAVALNTEDAGSPVGAAPAESALHPNTQALVELAMSLRRFDACLLPVTAETLGWTRTALSCARSGGYTPLCTPLVALTRNLKAAAVQDLLLLGMHDFVREPFCLEELRVRLERLASRRPINLMMDELEVKIDTGLEVCPAVEGRALKPSLSHPPNPNLGPSLGGNFGSHPRSSLDANLGPHSRSSFVADLGSNLTPVEQETLQKVGLWLADPATEYNCGTIPGALGSNTVMGGGSARAAQNLSYKSAPLSLSSQAINTALCTIQAAARIYSDEPFRVAKSRVVDIFERNYLRSALSRHAGNVARAARASSKHRRAFWALMRKHHIDAAPYRLQRDEADF